MQGFVCGNTYRTRTRHESSYPNPLKLVPGDSITVEDKPCEWPGWLWCTDEAGTSGWIPETYLRRRGAAGTMLVEYDATELNVDGGEEVEILTMEGSWARCRTGDGRTGWLPLEILEHEE